METVRAVNDVVLQQLRQIGSRVIGFERGAEGGKGGVGGSENRDVVQGGEGGRERGVGYGAGEGGEVC